MKLWDHQKRILDKNPQHVLLAHDVGLGKTVTLLEFCKHNAFSVLVITPKSLKLKWQEEVQQLENIESYVVTRDELKKVYDELPYYDTVIIDEISFGYGSTTSQMHKSLIKYLQKHNPEHVYSADATPYRSNPENLRALGRIHLYEPHSYNSFRERFYYDKYIGKKPVKAPLLKHESPKTRAEAQKDAHEYLSHFADIVKREDVFDVPEQVFEVIPIELTKKQNKMFEELDALCDNRSTLFTFLNQVENGYVSERCPRGEEMEFDTLKLDRIREIIVQNPQVLIFAKYRKQQKQIAQYLTKKFKKSEIMVLNGDNSSEAPKLAKKLDDAVGTDKVTALIANTSISAGYEAPHVRVCIYASLPFGFVDWEQSQGRILRSNNLKSNVYYILQSGIVDRQVYQNLMDGKDFNPVNYKNDTTDLKIV